MAGAGATSAPVHCSLEAMRGSAEAVARSSSMVPIAAMAVVGVR